VSRNGSVDWLCWPRFDSPSVFAALLDPERGGRWAISPAIPSSVERRYIHDTNVLETHFKTATGAAVLIDLMPVRTTTAMVPDHEIIRQIRCTHGEIEIDSSFQPRPKYGEDRPRLRQFGKLGLRFDFGRGVYWLRSTLPFTIEDSSSSASLRTLLRKGESLQFSFSYSEDAPSVLPPLEEIPLRIQICIDWWKAWSSRAQYDGDFRDEVVRSALALKLMTYSLSGAVIAAPTTSLPEAVGGSLNWDYRYCWLRDASLTIRSLLELGYDEEASHFMDWMLHATRLTRPKLQILYTVFGNPAPKEWESPVLRGYKGSSPVRIGNAARDQLQLDVYGEVIDAASQYAFKGGYLDREMQKVLLGFGDYVIKNWKSPDEGIWEPRSGRQNHTHSRLLCWTALDRLISLAEQGKLKCRNLEEYKLHREEIRTDITKHGWNEQLQSYVCVLGGNDLDSSLLLLSWYGFEKPESPRMQSTYRAIRRNLGTPDGLLYRYASPGQEGAFALCSFWEAEYLALGGGTLHDSKALLAHLLKYRNDLGLYGEEIDPHNGEALGNFPQAFTHIGLIGAALSLSQRQKGTKQLAHRRESANHKNSLHQNVGRNLA
jgi:GH15 family glucan-1,4-alpha-glucosidase